jgi:hypothetical protein
LPPALAGGKIMETENGLKPKMSIRLKPLSRTILNLQLKLEASQLVETLKKYNHKVCHFEAREIFIRNSTKIGTF